MIGQNKRESPERLPFKLKKIRENFNLTQYQMRWIIFPDSPKTTSNSAISDNEKGIRQPSILELLKYARFAKIPMENLADDNLDLPFYCQKRWN